MPSRVAELALSRRTLRISPAGSRFAHARNAAQVCSKPLRLLYLRFDLRPLGCAMRIAYLDCFSGISGDMFLGAAVDAGVPLEKLASVASALGLDTGLMAHRTQRAGISATKIDVLLHGHADQPDDEHSGSAKHSHAQGHEHSHAHEHAHEH